MLVDGCFCKIIDPTKIVYKEKILDDGIFKEMETIKLTWIKSYC